jgi:hypothetical protein
MKSSRARSGRWRAEKVGKEKRISTLSAGAGGVVGGDREGAGRGVRDCTHSKLLSYLKSRSLLRPLCNQGSKPEMSDPAMPYRRE